MADIVEYAQLIAKVDAKFDEILAKHPAAMRCSKKCSSCCQPAMTVSKVEQQSIQLFLEQHPVLKERIGQGPQCSDYCHFLSAESECLVYFARPIICRSHGAPVYRQEASGSRYKQVCELNFSDGSLDALDAEDFFNLDLLNTLLALINNKYFAAQARHRYRLDSQGILSGVPAFTI